MTATYLATYETSATVTVYIEVPDEVIQDADGDESVIEDWVAEKSHRVAEDYIDTWGIYRPALLDMSIDGIGAETIERIEDHR